MGTANQHNLPWNFEFDDIVRIDRTAMAVLNNFICYVIHYRFEDLPTTFVVYP